MTGLAESGTTGTGVLSNCPPVGNGVQSGQLENPGQLENLIIHYNICYRTV